MKTIIDYYVFCFDRYFSVEVPAEQAQTAKDIIDNAYTEWNNSEDDFVVCTPCEEYLAECLEDAGIDFVVIEQEETKE